MNDQERIDRIEKLIVETTEALVVLAKQGAERARLINQLDSTLTRLALRVEKLEQNTNQENENEQSK